jgi:hypothetical protein
LGDGWTGTSAAAAAAGREALIAAGPFAFISPTLRPPDQIQRPTNDKENDIEDEYENKRKNRKKEGAWWSGRSFASRSFWFGAVARALLFFVCLSRLRL